MEWIAAQPIAELFTTALTQAEIYYGLALLSESGRRDQLLAAARSMFDADLAGRVLPFDSDVADAYPGVAARRKQQGRPISQPMRRSRRSCTREALAWRPAMSGFLRLWNYDR